MTGSRPDWAAVGRIINERRRALGLPKNEAARRAGVSNTTWIRLERGENHNPTDATLVRVARVIEVRPEVLFGKAGRLAPDPAIQAAPVVHHTALPPGYPRESTPYFLGRADLLASIARYLERWEGLVWPLVLIGAPGVGKTAVAARYMADHRDAYDQLGWVRASSVETAITDLRTLASDLGLKPPEDAGHDALVDSVGHQIRTQERRLLLVVDDIHSDAAATPPLLGVLLTGHSNVRVLMTSRQGAGWQPALPLLVGPLRLGDAAEFLRQRTGSILQPPASAEAAQAEDPARALAAELGCLPRALEQAGAHLTATGSTLGGFLRLACELREGDRLLDLLDGHGGHHDKGTPTVWLPEVPPHGRRPAWDLLRILAFLAPAPLEVGYLTRPTVRLPISLSKLRELPDARAEYLFGSLVTALRRWSLVDVDDGVRVHPITQAAVRRSLGDARTTWVNHALDLLLSVLPLPDGGPCDHAACEHLRPHVQAAIRFARLEHGDCAVVARLLLRTAEHLRLAGDLDAARQDAEQAIGLLDSAGSAGVPATELVSLRLTRALIHADFGEFTHAQAQLEQASTTAGIGPDTAGLVEAHRAVIDAQLGLFDSASARVGRVMASLDSEPDRPTARTAAVSSSVALALKLLDEVDEARRRFDDAMTLRRRLVGTHHHGFALDCYRLGGVELRAEEPHRAAYWFQLGLDLFKELYGAEARHPRIGDCLRGLAAVGSLAGSPQDALARLAEAGAVYQGVFGFEHPARKTMETTRELLRVFQQQTTAPARSASGARRDPATATSAALRRYTQQQFAIGNFTRGFAPAAEAVTAFFVGVDLHAADALEGAHDCLTACIRRATPGSLLALTAHLRLGRLLAQRHDLAAARRCYQEILAATQPTHPNAHGVGAPRLRAHAARALNQLEEPARPRPPDAPTRTPPADRRVAAAGLPDTLTPDP